MCTRGRAKLYTRTLVDRNFGFRVEQRPNGGGGETTGPGGRDPPNPYSSTTKRGSVAAAGGFKQLALRKTDAAQPVVLVSMTRRPSSNSGQWKPFKWKSLERRGSGGGAVSGGAAVSGVVTGHPQQQQQQQQEWTNVDLNEDDDRCRQDTTTTPSGRVPGGQDNPAYSPSKHDV